jgi:hypothetical protein
VGKNFPMIAVQLNLCFEKKNKQKPTHPSEVERVLNKPTHGHGPLHFYFTPAHLARHGLANDFPSSPQLHCILEYTPCGHTKNILG